MFGKLLTNLGLGQSDLIEVFQGVLDRISRSKDMLTAELRDDVSFTVAAMIEELHVREVANDATYYRLLNDLEKWRKTGSPR